MEGGDSVMHGHPWAGLASPLGRRDHFPLPPASLLPPPVPTPWAQSQLAPVTRTGDFVSRPGSARGLSQRKREVKADSGGWGLPLKGRAGGPARPQGRGHGLNRPWRPALVSAPSLLQRQEAAGPGQATGTSGQGWGLRVGDRREGKSLPCVPRTRVRALSKAPEMASDLWMANHPLPSPVWWSWVGITKGLG